MWWLRLGDQGHPGSLPSLLTLPILPPVELMGLSSKPERDPRNPGSPSLHSSVLPWHTQESCSKDGGLMSRPLQPQRDVSTQPAQGLLQCTVLCSCPHKGTTNLVISSSKTSHFTCKAGLNPGLFGSMYQKMEKKLE